MIKAYRILSSIIYPFLLIFLYYRKIVKKEDPIRFKEKIFPSHFKVVDKDDSRLIWFHAASIGEFKSVIPIIEELKRNDEKLKFLITTTTLSSANLAKIELKKFKNINHRFLPLDVDFLIFKFLKLWRPDKIFLVDSEIWPNLLFNAEENNIPISLINARLTPKSFKNWMMFPGTARRIFRIFDLCMCSNVRTKDFLKELGCKNIFYKGNIKLISQSDKDENEKANENFILNKKFWFAASTHKGEDMFCLNTHFQIKKKIKDIVTIIAPRHIDRVKKIKSLSEKFNLKVQILNKNEIIEDNKEIILVNYFGSLKNFFKHAKSVFIGKSIDRELKNDGGQNPIEAAKFKCKIYHGPYVNNFEDIYKTLEKNNISKKIENFKELSENLITDLNYANIKDDHTFEIIKNLEQRTLKDTMKLVNSFIYDKIT